MKEQGGRNRDDKKNVHGPETNNRELQYITKHRDGVSVGVGDGGQGWGVSEERWKIKEKRENVCERGCGWMRRMLYIMAGVQE